jgi:transposase
MPKLLHARPPRDETERRLVCKLATSRHAPADWVWHAKMITRSWEGARTSTIAAEVGSHPQTVRERVHAFNARGLDGLGMKLGSGRTPRLTQAERSAIIALARTTPPGKLVPEPDSGELQAHDEEGVAEWTLDALAEAARSHGIEVARSQVRRMLLAERVRWRRTRLWATSADPDFAPKERRSSPAPPIHRPGRRSSVSLNSDR